MFKLPMFDIPQMLKFRYFSVQSPAKGSNLVTILVHDRIGTDVTTKRVNVPFRKLDKKGRVDPNVAPFVKIQFDGDQPYVWIARWAWESALNRLATPDGGLRPRGPAYGIARRQSIEIEDRNASVQIQKQLENDAAESEAFFGYMHGD